MKEVSVNLKDSSFREGQGVERRDWEEMSLSFWSGGGGEAAEEEEATESSRVSASRRTCGSERIASVGRWENTLTLVFRGGLLPDLGDVHSFGR